MIQDLKITEWENPIVNEADRPQRTAEEMKAIFDSNSNQLRNVVNSLIDALSSDGASSIGAEVQGMEGTSVQELLAELKELTDRVVTDQDGTLFLADDGTYKLPEVGAAANGLPVGGMEGQYLIKNSDRFYDADWADVSFMSEDMYDTNGDGVVDKADDADMLGGKLPSEYASKPTVYPATLELTNWSGDNPYTYTLSVPGITAASNGSIRIAQTATDEQWSAFGEAQIRVTGQSANTLTLTAIGEAPVIDIPVEVIYS